MLVDLLPRQLVYRVPGEKSRKNLYSGRSTPGLYGKCGEVFYPLEHVGVGGENLHHFSAGTQLYLFLAQVLELVVVDGAAQVCVHLFQLPYLVPGNGRGGGEEGLDALYPL